MAKELKPTEEQLAYAQLLDWGMKLGLMVLILTFAVYLFGLLPPYIPLDELPRLWKLNVRKFLEEAQLQSGWTWLRLINRGDYLNYLPIAFLAGLTILCYLRILPILFRKKEGIYAFLVILQVLILLLAASGILKVGGH